MGLFADQAQTFRVDLEGGAWVEMRSEITFGDRQAANQVATGGVLRMKGQTRGGKGDVGVEASWSEGDFTLALLERMIVAWSEEEPVSRQNIGRMPERIVDRLMEELNARNQGRSEDERGPLASSSTALSETVPSEQLPGLPT